MEIVPEAIIIMGAGVTGFIVAGLKGAFDRINDRTTVLTSAIVGTGVGLLVYASGIVDVGSMTAVQIAARAVLAGVTMGAAASGGQSWSAQLRAAPPAE